MKKTILSALLLSTVLFSCKKDNKNCDLNTANFAGSYKTVSIKYKATPSSAEIDVFSSYDACEKDDLVIFNANGTYTTTDSGVKCTPTTPDDGGAWSLIGSELTVDGETGTVTSFDCNNASINTKDNSTGESSTISLVRQ
ncbi:MAG: hypothetical protein ABJA37_15180 [Ferruginibacter sp.]